MRAFTEQDIYNAKMNRKIKIEQGKNFRKDFDDSESWDDLAKQYNIRLPAWWVAPEPLLMKRYLKKLKISQKQYCEACGDGWTLDDFAKLNPTFPLRAFVGNLLEYYDELQAAKERLNQID